MRNKRFVETVVIAISFFLLIGIFTEALSQEVVNFPDPALEAAIREAIAKPTGDIYDTDLIGLTILYANDRGITNLEGIQYCVDLTHLFLSTNQIVDISPLSSLNNLCDLDLGKNQISDISPLAGLNSLGWLWLDVNKITDISPLSDLTNLPRVDLGSNQIADIGPLSDLTNLWDLRLDNNQIVDISALSGLTNLRDLSLHNNQIVDISALSGLINLTVLYLHNNRIVDISALVGNAGLGSGDYLDIRYNCLDPTPGCDDRVDIYALIYRGIHVLYEPQNWPCFVVVDFPDPGLEAAIREAIAKPTGNIYDTDLVGLTNLDARGRSISNLEGIQNCTDLTVLFLNNNQISDLAPLAGLTNLTLLELGGNQISDISALTGLISLTSLNLIYNQISDITPLGSLINLETVILVDNQITDITALSGLINLDDIGLADNQISDVTALAGLVNLTTLHLNGNQISALTALAGLTKLTILELGGNQISDVSPLLALTNLTLLELGGNQINGITALAGLTSLTMLNLDDNQISDVTALSGLTNLTGLRLNGNQISNLAPLAGLTKLTTLDLGDNQISDISSLLGLMSLTELGLYQNEISDISSLTGLINLMYLYLDHNQINTIVSLASLTNLTQLELGNNQISDIAPLVSNAGIGSGDYVNVHENYLNLTPGSDDMQNIQALINRGVNVEYTPQNYLLMTTTLSSAGWHMITLPGGLCGSCADGAVGDLVCALSDDLDPCYIFHYDPTVGGYVMAPPPENICYHAGMGFWTRTYVDDVTIDAEVQVPTEAVEISLGDGWNQIGNPFPFAVAADALKVRCGDTELSLADAQAQGWVSAYLFGYDTASGGYVMIDPTTGCLQPWNGYWMRAYQDDCVLIIPPTECSSSSTTGHPLSVKELQARGLELPPPPPNDLMNLDVKQVLAGLTVRNVPNPIRSEHTTTFEVEGKGAELIQAIRVDIYDLSGHKVFTQDINAKELEWHTDNEAGELLANGVYLYQVWVKIAGLWYPTRVQKLAVVR